MPSTLTATPPPSASSSIAAPGALSQEAKQKLLDFLRVRENPFEILVSLQKADWEAVQNYVPGACQDIWARLQAIIRRHRPERLEYESDLPRTGVVTIIGARGSGKTAALHALQLTFETKSERHIIVAPTDFEPSRSFNEYLYLELIRHLKEEPADDGSRIIDLLSEAFARQVLVEALRGISKVRWIERWNASILDFFLALRGWRTHEVVSRKAGIIKDLECAESISLPEIAKRNEVTLDLLAEIASRHIEATMPETTLSATIRKGLYHKLLCRGLGECSDDVFEFLYDGFTQVNLQGNHSKEARVNEVFQALIELCLLTRVPVLFAFDSLETLLPLHPERCVAFFNGLATVIDTVRGLAFLIFAESGHWQELVKFRGSFAAQRMVQGIVGVPEYGAISELLLPPLSPAILKGVIQARMTPLYKEFFGELPSHPLQLFAATELDAAAGKGGAPASFRDGLARIRDLYAERVQKRPVASSALTGTGLSRVELLHATWSEVLVTAKIEATNLSGSSLGPIHQGLLLWFRSFQQEGQANIVDATNDTSGDHPTFGQVTLFHRERDAAVEKIAIGFFVGQGSSMPTDLGTKLRMLVAGQFSQKIDRMIILWPKLQTNDPVAQLPKKTKEVWTDIVKDELATRISLRYMDPSVIAIWLALPKWRTKVTAEFPDIRASELDHYVVEQTKDLLKWVLPT